MYPSRLFTASDDLLKIINTCSPKAHATRNIPTPPPPLSPSVSLHPPGPRRYVPDPPHLLLKSFSTLFSLPLPLPLLLSLSPSGTSQVKQLSPPSPHAHLFTPSPSLQRSLFRLSCGCEQHSSVPLVSLSCLLFYCPTHPAVHPQAYITTSGASTTLSSLFIPAVIYSFSPSMLFLVSPHHFIIQLKPLLSVLAVILQFLRGPES